MKKINLLFSLIFIVFLACKKKTETPSSPDNKNCMEDTDIDFSYIGTPIGSFANCIQDIDGNVYKTIIIGKQQWMAENLRTSRYNDGSLIPNCIESVTYLSTAGGVRCFYKNDSINYAKYGTLYNWYVTDSASNGNKNVCPSGWHVPSIEEWRVLINQLGGDSVAGGKMKQVGSKVWNIENVGASNSSLFTALPSGKRNPPSTGIWDSDGYQDFGENGFWWSKTREENDYLAWRISLSYFRNKVDENLYYEYAPQGMSIRCVKD